MFVHFSDIGKFYTLMYNLAIENSKEINTMKHDTMTASTAAVAWTIVNSICATASRRQLKRESERAGCPVWRVSSSKVYERADRLDLVIGDSVSLSILIG